MNIKTTILAIVSSIAVMANSGLYFVSGGDFRNSYLKYTVETTNSNQEVEITPSEVSILRNWGNQKFAGPWSVKSDGREYEFTEFQGINSPYQSGGCSNVSPLKVSYSNPGQHLVKMFDPKGNLYQLSFKNMDELTSLYYDYTKSPSSSQFGVEAACTVMDCKNLRSIYFNLPENSVLKQNFVRLPKLIDFKLEHPEYVKSIPDSWFNSSQATNDMVFLNVTNIDSWAFCNANNIEYLCIPRIQKMGRNVFGRWSSPTTGLKSIMIGDELNSIGEQCFVANRTLKTIEFASDREDWLDFWNNTPVLRDTFGQATAVEGQPDKATLTKVTDYFKSDVNPTTLIHYTRA